MVFQVSAGFFIKNVSAGFQPLILVLDNFTTLVVLIPIAYILFIFPTSVLKFWFSFLTLAKHIVFLPNNFSLDNGSDDQFAY